jgi:hypothetical protein
MHLGGMNLSQRYISAGVRETCTEAVALPYEFLKGVASIDAIFA